MTKRENMNKDFLLGIISTCFSKYYFKNLNEGEQTTASILTHT